VRIDVVPTDPKGEVREPDATAAAQEAVFNALKEAEWEGLARDHADRFSLTVDYVEAIDLDDST